MVEKMSISQADMSFTCYDAIFRIVPEGFKIMKDISRDDIVSVIATDELIKDEWVEKAEGYIVELNTPKTWD